MRRETRVSAEFLVTTLVVVATPGTGVLYTLAAGLSRGARASVLAAFACTLGIVPHMLAAITGVAAVLHTSAVAFQTLKYLGVAYLLWMAWTTFRDTTPLVADEDAAPVRGRGRGRGQGEDDGIGHESCRGGARGGAAGAGRRRRGRLRSHAAA